jgi:hypothetical protein
MFHTGTSEPYLRKHNVAATARLWSDRQSLLDLRIEANGQNLLTRRDIVTYRQISLLWDRDVVEPGKLFFLRCSTVASAHIL